MGFLKSRYFLISLGMVILIALVLLLGAVMDLDPVYQLLGVIVVLITFILILAVGFVRANRNAGLIEQSIKAQAQQQRASARPDKQAEIEALQERLEQAIEQIKQSKLGRGRRGKAALYALPWYMFIGPPAAGKTTTIANSGLNFPIGTDRIQGVGGTRNCDWFFSDAAILLDTAGRYTTEYEDNDEWVAFLETLSKHRKEQPINGVLIGISIADLVAADPHDVDWHAETIRRRIDELMKHLGVRFPVYLVFTKCDLLQGFVEFFGDLTRQERDQVWGATIPPDQWEHTDMRGLFEEEFDRLYEALVTHRLDRLSRSLKREDRNKVYAFPLQFAAAKDSLSRFVGQLFLPNPYQETPIFRGFYFTSGTQEGVPLDRVIETLARQFGLAAGGGSTEPVTETKSYFIRNLFSEVVIPDQYVVESTSKATKQRRLLRASVGIAAGVGVALFVLWALLAMRGGMQELRAVEQTAGAFQTVQWDGSQAPAPGVALLDSLLMRIQALEDGSILSLGLRPRTAVLDSARALYQANLRAFVRSYPLRALEEELALARTGMERAEKDTMFKDLKSYLLLTAADPGLDARRDSLVAANDYELVRRLSYRAATAAGSDQLRSRVHIQAFVDALAQGRQAPFPGQASRADRARAAIGDIDEGVYYLQVLDNVQARLQGDAARLELRDIVRAGSGFFVNDSLGVDGVFTRGAHDLVMEEIRAKSENPYSDAWVLGQPRRETVQLGDLEQKLTARYYDAYATAWAAFLRSVTLRGVTTIPAAQDLIQTLSSPQRSPVVRLLGVATVETDVCNTVSGLVADAGLGEAAEAAPCAGQFVNDRFQWLHVFQFNRAASGSGAPDVDLLLQSFEEAGSDLESVAGSGEDAVIYAAQLLENEQFGVGGKLREVQRTLGASFDRRVRENLFEQPLIQAGGAIIGAAARTFDERWRMEVYEPFQRIADLYPFTAEASAPDAAYGDVQDFFSPDPEIGAVARFRQDLEPFLERGDLRRANTWQGYGLNLDGIRPSLERAAAIGEALSNRQLTFRIRPDRTDRGPEAPPAGPLILTVHGQTRQYDQGNFREWWAFQWPGTERGVELRINGPAGPLVRYSQDGIWALFRFMQDARGEAETSPGIFERRWLLTGQGGSYTFTQPLEIEVNRNAEAMLLTPRRFFSFRPPESM